MNPNTITKTFRITLLLGISIVGGFSQDSTTAPTGASVTMHALPVQRVLTDAAGRKFDATIIEKSATGIKCKRTSDGVEFNIPFAKLSAADRNFLSDLDKPAVAAPTSAPTAITAPSAPAPAKPATLADKSSKMPFFYFLTVVRDNGSQIKAVAKILSRIDGGYKVIFPYKSQKANEPYIEGTIFTRSLNEQDIKFLAVGPPEDKPDYIWGTPPNLPYSYELTLNAGRADEMQAHATILSRVPEGYNVSLSDNRNLPSGKSNGICIIPFNELSPQDRKFLDRLDYSIPTRTPCLYTLNFPDGKKLEGTIITKGAVSIKFRDSNGMDQSIPLTKLTAKDREVIAGISNTTSDAQTLPAQFELIYKDGKTLQATILKRAGKDFSAFLCKKSNGKEITVDFSEFSAETQNELAQIVTQEPTPFPMWCRLITEKEGRKALEFHLILEKTGTEIKCKNHGKVVTIPIADLSEESRKFVEAPVKYITGVPRRFKKDITPTNTEKVIPAGEVVWVTKDSIASMWLPEGFGPYCKRADEIGTPRKFDYEIVTSYKGKEYRIHAGDPVYVVKEDATTLTIWGASTFYAATVTKPTPGTTTVNAIQFDMPQADQVLPNLADPPFGLDEIAAINSERKARIEAEEKAAAKKAAIEAAMEAARQSMPSDLADDMAIPRPPNPKFWYWPHAYGATASLGMPYQAQIQYLWGALQITNPQMDKLMGAWVEIVVKTCDQNGKQMGDAVKIYAVEREAILTPAQKETRERILKYFDGLFSELKAQGITGQDFGKKLNIRARKELPGILTPMEICCWKAVEEARSKSGGTPGK